LTDPLFLLSCALVLINHYFWFTHFQTPPHHHPSHYSTSSRYTYTPDSYPTFTEISSYFGLCVWLVPFSLFVGLSAGENVLPSMGSEYATGEGSSFVSAGREPGLGGSGGGTGGAAGARDKKSREGLAKALVNGVREWVGGTGEALGLWREEGARARW